MSPLGVILGVSVLGMSPLSIVMLSFSSPAAAMVASDHVAATSCKANYIDGVGDSAGDGAVALFSAMSATARQPMRPLSAWA